MPKIEYAQIEDFTGGLHLIENRWQLADNESPDMCNVDVDDRGGFRLRGGVSPFGSSTGLADDPKSLFMYESSSASPHILASDGTNIVRKNGAAWTTVGAMSGTVRFQTFKDRVYAQNGSSVAHRWDGTTYQALGNAAPSNWNNDITSPTAHGSAGNMPVASCITAWKGCLFVANTVEDGSNHPNRVRWSHPNFPEDWFEVHYIDIDEGVDGDEIVRLEPMGDHLLVFKQRSIHAVYGNPPEQFEVYQINPQVGALSQDAVVSTDNGIYFYSWPDGLFRYDGKFEWVHERIHPIIEDGEINAAYNEEVTLGWGNRRLWVSVPWGTSTTRNRVFVLDPVLSKQGSWTKYDLSVGPFLEYNPPGEEAGFYASAVGETLLVELDNHSQPYDDYGSGEVHIDSYYVTRWYDLGTNAMKKRWKRPMFAIRGGTAGEITVQGFKNYDITVPTRNFTLVSTADASAGVWDTSTWDNATYGRDVGVRNQLERGSQLGNAYSVALRFEGPADNVDWGIDAITLKFIPRKVRN